MWATRSLPIEYRHCLILSAVFLPWHKTGLWSLVFGIKRPYLWYLVLRKRMSCLLFFCTWHLLSWCQKWRLLSCAIQVVPYNTVFLSELKWVVSYKPICSQSPAHCTRTRAELVAVSRWSQSWLFLVSFGGILFASELVRAEGDGELFGNRAFQQLTWLWSVCQHFKRENTEGSIVVLSTYLLCPRISFCSELLQI